MAKKGERSGKSTKVLFEISGQKKKIKAFELVTSGEVRIKEQTLTINKREEKAGREDYR